MIKFLDKAGNIALFIMVGTFLQKHYEWADTIPYVLLCAFVIASSLVVIVARLTRKYD